MQYITKDDLIKDAHERLIDESGGNEAGMLDKIEASQIGIIKSYLGSRYNVEAIFDEDSPIENEVLKSILVRMVLYRLFKRNAARKVPTDSKEDYDAAMKELTDISTGKIKLEGLPVAVDGSGQPVSNTLWGNNTNENFYI